MEFFYREGLYNTFEGSTLRTSTETCSLFENIDSIFFGEIYQSILEGIHLWNRNIFFIKISKQRYSNRSEIISICMSSLYIITSCTTLIYCSILTDNIMISYISPSTSTSMICIYGTQYSHIITECLLYSFCCMMNNDPIYGMRIF